MSGVKDGSTVVKYPCRVCMVENKDMGNVEKREGGYVFVEKHAFRTKKFLDMAKKTYKASEPHSSLGFVIDRSRPVLENINWKYPFQIYCMTPMCILHVFLSHGIAEYAIKWTKMVCCD